jgi:hypothetical protein
MCRSALFTRRHADSGSFLRLRGVTHPRDQDGHEDAVRKEADQEQRRKKTSLREVGGIAPSARWSKSNWSRVDFNFAP